MKAVDNHYCLIYNFPQHYRSSTFKNMDRELGFKFYFGDSMVFAQDVKEMDVNELNGYVKRVKNIRIFFTKFIWQKGVVSLVFKNYKHFILYGEPTFLSNWCIMLMAKLLRKKTYLWMHGIKGQLTFKDKLIRYPYYYLADKMLLYSDYSRCLMLTMGFKAEKMTTIYNSLDYDNQIDVRNNLVKSDIYKNKFENELPTLIYIGRIQKSKKLNLIIESMNLLRLKGVCCNLVIVGEDKEQVYLEKFVLESNFSKNVWFYGPCYDEKIIGELIFNADVCVSPGNVGLTAMHSFVYGTPLITHSNFEKQGPEFEVIEPGVNGDFFEEDNAADLSAKISQWIGINEEMRERVRKSTYKIIDERYNPDYQINVLKKVLDYQNE
ncbi:MAG: glycosyltransferase [Flavobacterium sp.]|nr:glycosyltransferase [Flavobacterium sp.]